MELNSNTPKHHLQLWNEGLLLLTVQHCLKKIYTNVVMLTHIENGLYVPYSPIFKEELIKSLECLHTWVGEAQKDIYKRFKEF